MKGLIVRLHLAEIRLVGLVGIHIDNFRGRGRIFFLVGLAGFHFVNIGGGPRIIGFVDSAGVEPKVE